MRSKRSHMTCLAEEEMVGARKPHPNEPRVPEEPEDPYPPATDEPPNAKKPPKHAKLDEGMEPPDREPPHVDSISRPRIR
ncbi:MAG: hypothetical protein M4D80_06675 [Myxococcota bacterium]|nr:hypothetical protein [Myxococcota bacterium]